MSQEKCQEKSEMAAQSDEPKPKMTDKQAFCQLLLVFLFFFTYVVLRPEHKGLVRQSESRLGYVALYTPEQIHLSLGIDGSEVYVTWSTKASARCRVVLTGLGGRPVYISRGNITSHTLTSSDEDWKKLTGQRTFKFHNYRAKIYPLDPGEYIYQVDCLGSDSERISSRSYRYRAKNLSNENSTVKIAFYGDLGLFNGKSIPRLINDIDEDKYDLIIHNGDFAYDLDTHNGEYGDEFMRKIEPIAARVPYQTSVGNHENAKNFTFYDMRFSMINQGVAGTGLVNNFYYSFNVGPIHFVAFSTEFYYYRNEVGIVSLRNQYEWLKADLSHASSAVERAKRPWIIVFGHRPMYCSSRDGDDCSKESNILRKGLPGTGEFALEKLFYDFGVDIEMYSHEHQYERFLPIFNGTVFNRTQELESYYDPLAPVHIISGSAGCQERLDPFMGTPRAGSVMQIADYGFTTIQATRCQILFEQISDDQYGSVVDRFYVTKKKQNFPPNSADIKLDCQDKFDRKGCYGHRARLCWIDRHYRDLTKDLP